MAGTDRQVRGAVMAVLRSARSPVLRGLLLGPVDQPAAEADSDPDPAALAKLHALQAPASQLERAVAGLLADKLAEENDGGLQLPA